MCDSTIDCAGDFIDFRAHYDHKRRARRVVEADRAQPKESLRAKSER
jgi:hypothetical protein